MNSEEYLKYQKEGWAGPFALLDTVECRKLNNAYEKWNAIFTPSSRMQNLEDGELKRRPWFKSMHAYIPEFFELVQHPGIVHHVKQLLGENIVAWGCTVTVREPGRVHSWHVDVEQLLCNGVTVFLGLKNTFLETSLSLITGSHLSNLRPSDFTDPTVEAMTEILPEKIMAKCETPNVTDGKFIILSGHIWHSSANISEYTRKALIIQYCATDSPVKIPLNWMPPFKYHAEKPPCVVASGRGASSANRLVTSPILYDSAVILNEVITE